MPVLRKEKGMNKEELSLYNLSETIAKIIDEGLVYDEESGEVYFDESDLEGLQETLDKKMENLVNYITYLEDELIKKKHRKEAFDKKVKFTERKIERLKNYLQLVMSQNNIEKKKLGDHNISFYKSTKLMLDDKKEELMYTFLEKNDKYKNCYKVETTKKVDKNELKKLLKAGEEIPGVSLVEGKSVVIR